MSEQERIKAQVLEIGVALIDPQGYVVQVTQQHNTRRGVYWAGTIYSNGIAIGTCENEGNGGQTRVYIENHLAHQNFHDAAAKAYPASGEPHSEFCETLSVYSDLGYTP